MKIIFAGTPEFAVPSLEALVEHNFDVALVISQEDRPRGRGKKLQPTPVKKRAMELGLEVYQPSSINSEESIERLKEVGADFLVVAAFGQILKKEVLSIAKVDSINVHASLLPKYRGAAPINWAIINGEDETGITIMKIEEGLDTGDMISKAAIPILDEDDAITVHDKLSKLGGEILVSTLKDIMDGKASYTPQNDDESSYAPMLSRETGRIDWSKSSRDIFNLIRGLKPWPGSYTNYGDDLVKIHSLRVLDEAIEGQAGEIVKVSNEGLYVATGDGVVIIEELQFPNKRRMKVREYLAGNSIESGRILK